MAGIKNQIKSAVFRKVLAKNPRMLRLARNVQFALWQTRKRIRRAGRSNGYDPEAVLWVNPAQIESYIGGSAGDRFSARGEVRGGDWDLEATPFEGWDVYRAIESRFTEETPWEETAFYRRICSDLDRGEVKWGCTNRVEFQQRLKGLEALFEDIRVNGFKSQEELAEGEDPHAWEKGSPLSGFDNVIVSIDRRGRFLLRDGKHRLSMAKVLGIERIPVSVGLRHQEWHAFREEVLEWAGSRGGLSYQPFTHPDLQDIPAQHDDGRFDLMRENLALERGAVLNIGSFFGYFCHRFEEAGFDCTAAEFHPRHVYFMEKLREAEGRRFDIRSDSILDVRGPLKFDVVLALNIFHHFLKTRESFTAFEELLRRVEARVMFFEPHCTSDAVMEDAYRNFEPDEFVRFILENSSFETVRKLGTVARGRSLYVFEKEAV